MGAAVVLIGRQAGDDPACLEGLPLGFGGDDQLVLQRADDQAMFELGIDGPARPTCAVERVVVEKIAVGRAQRGGADTALPAGFLIAQRQPKPPCRQPVAAVVERVGALEAFGIVAVELTATGEGEGGCAEREPRARLIRAVNSSRQVAVAVPISTGRAEAVDSIRPLPTDTASDARLARDDGARRTGPAETERAALGRCRKARFVAGTTDRDDAANRIGPPQRRLRAAHDLDPRGKIGIEQFEPREVAGGGVVGADAVDEQQGVVVLGAANADFGEQSGGALGGHRDRGRHAEQSRDQWLAETLDALGID